MLPAGNPLTSVYFVPELSSKFIPINYSSYVQGTQLSLYALFQDGIVDPGQHFKRFLWSVY